MVQFSQVDCDRGSNANKSRNWVLHLSHMHGTRVVLVYGTGASPPCWLKGPHPHQPGVRGAPRYARGGLIRTGACGLAAAPPTGRVVLPAHCGGLVARRGRAFSMAHMRDCTPGRARAGAMADATSEFPERSICSELLDKLPRRPALSGLAAS